MMWSAIKGSCIWNGHFQVVQSLARQLCSNRGWLHSFSRLMPASMALPLLLVHLDMGGGGVRNKGEGEAQERPGERGWRPKFSMGRKVACIFQIVSLVNH